MAVETKEERHVWDLLIRDFWWKLPPDFPVKVYGESSEEPVRLQVFEVAIAAVFESLRPDYEWYVTPNLAGDGGLDFLGEQWFLEDAALGIAAAITIGGQCKKRSRVDNPLDEVASSLIQMSAGFDPTFVVFVLSARVSPERIAKAQRTLAVTQRHCHILARRQVEGLMQDNLAAIDEILRKGLGDADAQTVLDYFAGLPAPEGSGSIEATVPDRVLAGAPFTVTLDLHSPVAATRANHLWWLPAGGPGADDRPVTLVGPLEADGASGYELQADVDDPLNVRCTVELLTHAVGRVDLGEVVVGSRDDGPDGLAKRVALGRVQVVENVRPRFFDRPFRTVLTRLSQEYDRALAGGVASIGVVGAGGSGKSRVCEEFSLERRRRGCSIVTARQTKTLDDPHRILADLFVGLVPEGPAFGHPADPVVQAVRGYDSQLAERAEPAIRSIFGTDGRQAGAVTDQSVLSALLLLIVARGRREPLIVHLQDLHWCTADVLALLERLMWQLDHLLSAGGAPTRSPESGILFIFEGRIRELQGAGDGGWTSEPFEAFLQKLDCTVAPCTAFDPEDGLEFIRRLFEDGHSARRLVNAELLELQAELVERIHRSAGGNPFHSLEQVQLLKESGIIGQNPETGLLYLIKPTPSGTLLPDSVFESIRLRWRYLRERAPELALLVWAAALLEDRLPMPLFRHLWSEMAPDVSLREIDATDLLWTGQGEEYEVAFRHENYFRSIRLFEVPAADRERVVGVYVSWFEAAKGRDPADRFRQARALLELPEPDSARARALMKSALGAARRRGDARLAQRIATAALDLSWREDERSALRADVFLRRCDEDLALVRDLLGHDRSQAGQRLEAIRRRIDGRILSGQGRTTAAVAALRRRELTAEVLRSQHLFNDRQPALAAEVGASAARAIEALRRGGLPDDGEWEQLEMEALHSHAVGLALSGDSMRAVEVSARAVEIAHRSPSEMSPHIVNTYAAIVQAIDPARSEAVLRECLAALPDGPAAKVLRDEAELNLGMALIVRAYELRLAGGTQRIPVMLDEATALLTRVFTSCFQFGQYPVAGAAALLLGLISALRQAGEEVYWFAQAVAAAARGRQMETLWRSHINLATALHKSGADVHDGVRDHARAALDIIEETLSPYPEPDRSLRFRLVEVPLANAVRFLLLAGDDCALAVLERYPALRARFDDVGAAVLRDDSAKPWTYFDWLRIDGASYVVY